MTVGERDRDYMQDVFRNQDDRYLCQNSSEYCSVKSPKCITIHSLYDVGEKVADIMENKRSMQLCATMIFHSNIFLYESGTIPKLDVTFSRFMRNGREVIEFVFVNDSSLTYTHDYETYTQLFRKNLLVSSTGKSSYVVEITEIRNGVAFLIITRLLFTNLQNASPVALKHRVYFPE